MKPVSDRRGPMEGRRDSDSPHNSCTAHSGLNTKTNLILAFSGMATFLTGVAITLLIQINSGLATTDVAMKSLEKRVTTLEDRMSRHESRGSMP